MKGGKQGKRNVFYIFKVKLTIQKFTKMGPKKQIALKKKDELLWLKELYSTKSVFIEKDIFGRCYGNNNIRFVNLQDGSEKYHRVSNINNYGALCLAAHQSYRIFAFAELKTQPNIFICTYPEFVQIKKFRRPETQRYTILNFSETDYLIAFSGLPEYKIELWNWRTGKLLAVQETNIITDFHNIKCCRLQPLLITQLASKRNKLNFWEVYISVDRAMFLKRNVNLPCQEKEAPLDFVYSLDGSIFLINKYATIWQIFQASNKTTKIITWPESGPCNNFLLLYKSGLLVSGPDGSIKHFKKTSGEWNQIWTLKPEMPVFELFSYAQEMVGGFFGNGVLMKLIDESGKQRLNHIKTYGRSYKLLAMLNPINDAVIALDRCNQLYIINIITGQMESSMTIDHIQTLESHPSLPFFALGDSHGVVHLLSAYNTTEIKIITEFYLSDYSIDDIVFGINGGYLIAMDEFNDLFIIKCYPEIEIVHHLVHNQKFSSWVAIDQDNTITITALILPLIAKHMQHTDQLIQYELNLETFALTTTTLNLENNYRQLSLYDPLSTTTKFAIVRHFEPSFDIAEIATKTHTNELNLEIVKHIKAPHKGRNFNLYVGRDYFLTCGVGKKVIVWEKETMTTVDEFVSYNRYIRGIRKIIWDETKQISVALSWAGSLICLKMLDVNIQSFKRIQLIASITTSEVKDFFTKNPVRENPTYFGKTYVQLKIDDEKEREANLYRKERESILNDFKILKEKLRQLIDKNDHAPEEEKLPIEAFNIDKWGTEIKVEKAQNDRDLEIENMKKWHQDENKAIDLIIDRTWNKMKTKALTIRGIFTKLRVENYPLLQDRLDDARKLKQIKLWRQTENRVGINDTFLPWKPWEANKLELMLAHVPHFIDIDRLSREEGSTVDLVGVETNTNRSKYSLSGSNSYKFIAPFPLRYDQLDVVTFHQMIAENIMGQHDILELRKYFNKQFDKIKSIKEIEMNCVEQRNTRLRHIQRELNIMEKLKESGIEHNDLIKDAKFMSDEVPDLLVQVEDHEIPITPYISPSQQKLIDERTSEIERRRLELMADDFRDRALVKMMDGVLEILWEDEIKKTPEPPLCISSGKDPKDYNETDLVAIRDFEFIMTKLRQEREKYRNMLLDEQTQIKLEMRDQLLKFNKKIGDILLEKMRVEFAIGSEDLKLLRNQLFNFQRRQFQEKENNLKKDIENIKDEIENLMKIHRSLEELYTNCKNKYEEISTKDRMLDRQFKVSFAEFGSQAVADQAYRIFRRRPKWQMRAGHTEAIFQDMAKRLNTGDYSVNGPPLPEECFLYLNLIDQADKLTNMPIIMDQTQWQIFCKMRRVKIEIEFRVRSIGAQLADAESTANAFQKEINAKRTKLAQFEKSLEELKIEQKMHILNRTIQICIKLRNIEIPLSGHLSDFDDSILLHETDVHSINNIIKKAGEKKIKAMQNAAVFRRKIICKEWEWEVLKMKIEEKEEFIKLIEKCKITKEVQMFLKRKHLGWRVEITGTDIERQIMATTNALESACNEMQKQNEGIHQCVQAKRAENNLLDKKIQSLNLMVSEQNLKRDMELEIKDSNERKRKLTILVERSRLTRKCQQQHAKILELTTMLELLKLRTYPTLNVAPERKINIE